MLELTLTIEDLHKLGLGEEVLERIKSEVKIAVHAEIRDLRPAITAAVTEAVHRDVMRITREVLKSEEMQKSVKAIAVGIGAAAVKRHIERIADKLYAELKEDKNA